jgi:magnesium transporter
MLARLTEANLEDPVSRYARADCTRLRIGQTVGDALEELRREPPAERIIYFYVVDDDGRLQGVVPTRHLLLNPLERPLAEIMVRHMVTLPATATVREACEFFALHRFLALPVVDEDRRLLGVIDMELYTDELSHLTDADKRDDLFQAIGVYAARPGESSPWGAFRRRFPWLGCNLAGGIACALIASFFDAQLQKVVALALFIPVVLNLAESVASQSVSLTLHLLRGHRPDWRLLARGIRCRDWLGGASVVPRMELGIVLAGWRRRWRRNGGPSGAHDPDHTPPVPTRPQSRRGSDRPCRRGCVDIASLSGPGPVATWMSQPSLRKRTGLDGPA